jgi:uncharacterized damage-inducible protein DinB
MTVKDLLLQHATYHLWAHKRLLELINTLAPEQHQKVVPSSFNSLYKTIFHVWEAESLWFARLSKSVLKVPEDSINGSMAHLSKSLEWVDQQWIDWISAKSDTELTEKIHYTNKAGQPFYQSQDTLLTHIFNHNTYHNGQLVTMLRALEVENIPATDFIVWSRLQTQ